MAVSIKNKIRSGTLFLFLLLIISGGVSIYFLLKLKDDSKNIIRANYESLDYSHKMQQQLDSIPGAKVHATIFDSLLSRQENNLTEKGEKEQTQILREDFEKLQHGDTTAQVRAGIKTRIQSILLLNMDGIQRKNGQAQQTA